MKSIKSFMKKVPDVANITAQAVQAASTGATLLAQTETGKTVTNYTSGIYKKNVKPAVDFARNRYGLSSAGHLPLTRENLAELNSHSGTFHWHVINGHTILQVESVPYSDEINFSDAHKVTLSDYAKSLSDVSCSGVNTSIHSQPLSEWEFDSDLDLLGWDEDWENVLEELEKGGEELETVVERYFERKALEEAVVDMEGREERGEAGWKNFGEIAKGFFGPYK